VAADPAVRSQSAWARFLALPKDSPAKVVAVTVAVCLVCSVLVSTAAVILKPVQMRNAELARQKEILKVAGLYGLGVDVTQAFTAIETRYVDLDTGRESRELPADALARSTPLAPDADIAGIGRRPVYRPVYWVRRGANVETLVVPVYGKGLWSTVHGFVALTPDGRSVKDVTFYDHGETPGLGGEISNPSWQAKWDGKQIYGADGSVALRVIKGAPKPGSPDAAHQIDGLSGATLTGNGITHLIQFWLGAQGYGPFLTRLAKSADAGG
jgi:Na+-transporting NADH:ubiquinone oxidoreductase subunit C